MVEQIVDEIQVEDSKSNSDEDKIEAGADEADDDEEEERETVVEESNSVDENTFCRISDSEDVVVSDNVVEFTLVEVLDETAVDITNQSLRA